jgi:hypothetical protein
MNAKISAILNAWFQEEMEALIAQGATLADTREPSFHELLATKVGERHKDEIRTNSEMGRAFLVEAIFNGSPDTLRKFAGIFRERDPDSAMAYDFETLADQRERGTEKGNKGDNSNSDD